MGATGSGLKYQWQYSENGGSTWKNSTGTGYATASLKVRIVYANFHERLYRCVVTDQNGGVLICTPALLTVNSRLISQPEAQSGQVGNLVRYTVGASGPGLKYQWQYSENGGTSWKNSVGTGNTTATLKVRLYDGFDGRLYRCLITDANGVVLISNPASLTVTK